MTPRETLQAIETAAWRMEQEAKRNIALAWHIAALTRARRMPSLHQLLARDKAKRLRGKEAERRRREYEEMTAALEASGLNVRKRHGR